MSGPNVAEFRMPRRRIFNPLRLTDEEIGRAFIARRPLLESLLADLAAENSERAPQHHLIVGQRGMGKTMLLCRIAAELRKPDYRDRFLPLTFPEEQYVEIDRLSKFWLNCLDAVADALEAGGDRAAARALDAQVRALDSDSEDESVRADRTRAALQAAIERTGRRPVLLLDNLHLLLDRLRSQDFVLRGFFTRQGAPVLVGAATVFPDSLHDYGAAFYDSFKTHVLYRLSVEEMREIIVQLAREASRPDVAARVHAEMPRLRALRELTGGNPRTALLLFELFAQGFSDDPYEDLESLLDQITPLYQSRLEQLSEQAQLLFAALARQWSPATAEQLTAATQLPRGSISPQLGRLEAIGLVEKVPVFPGKKTGYQIAERFFNIWYLMRFATRRQRTALECLTRFLEGFYTPPELKTRARRVLGKTALSDGEATYALALAEAIAQRGLAHDLRTHAELTILRQTAGVREQIARIIDPADLSPQAIDFDEQRRRLVALVPDDSSVSPDEFAELVLGSISLLPPNPKFDRRSIAASETLTREQIEEIMRIFRDEQRKWIEQYSEEADIYVRNRLRSGSLAAWTDEAGFAAAIEQATNARAAHFLGDLAIEKGHSPDLAEQAYRHACQLDPKDADPWNNLGNLLVVHLGRYDEAEQAYRHACQLDPKWAYPWNGLGNLLTVHLGQYDEAEQAYRHACQLDPKDAVPWNGLGNLLMDCLGKVPEAEQVYRRAIAIDSSAHFARYNLVFLLRDLRHDFAAARPLLAETTAAGEGRDTRALHEALFAAYGDDWDSVRAALASALAEIGERLPSDTRDDWCRASAVLVHLGFGPRLIELLTDQGADVRLMPWFAAVEAHVLGDQRYLQNIPAEAREVANEIYEVIERWKRWLPEWKADLRQQPSDV